MTESHTGLPDPSEVARLPRGAAQAFAQRCAARALDQFMVAVDRRAFARDLDLILEAQAAVAHVARFCDGGDGDGGISSGLSYYCESLPTMIESLKARSAERGIEGAGAAARSTIHAVRCAMATDARTRTDEAVNTAHAAWEAGSATGRGEQLERLMRADLESLDRLAREKRWDDSETVRPSDLGGLWRVFQGAAFAQT